MGNHPADLVCANHTLAELCKPAIHKTFRKNAPSFR
jgi:hypothetical protein